MYGEALAYPYMEALPSKTKHGDFWSKPSFQRLVADKLSCSVLALAMAGLGHISNCLKRLNGIALPFTHPSLYV